MIGVFSSFMCLLCLFGFFGFFAESSRRWFWSRCFIEPVKSSRVSADAQSVGQICKLMTPLLCYGVMNSGFCFWVGVAHDFCGYCGYYILVAEITFVHFQTQVPPSRPL